MTVRTGSITLLILGAMAGCSRSHYRHGADSEAYCVLEQKASGTPWQLPPDYSIQQGPESRLADPPNPDCPTLPPGQPRLNTYELPATRRSVRSAGPESLAKVAEPEGPGGDRPGTSIQLAFLEEPAGSDQRSACSVDIAGVALLGQPEEVLQPPRGSGAEYATGLPLRPVPVSAWQALPRECLLRMLEFANIREEYQRSFTATPPDELRDKSRRLSIEDIIELALLNSRTYQTEKEKLYKAALTLTLERFAYDLKFSQKGNGSALDYLHAQTGGTSVSTLGIPSQLQLDKILTTGGDLLARFANDVVLTFGGPNGFTSDVSSEMLFRVTQPLIQRDIRLEPLIQSERDVVYAARTFARFRRQFFFGLATEYYALLRTHRQVQIDAQNYFSLVRAFNQGEAEERAGLQSRMQVEQIEQKMLQGQSNLITTCNQLEAQLDRLKITMGLPTELGINLDLTELNELTLRDEVQVAGERVSRALRRLSSFRQEPEPDRPQILNASIVLNDRLVEWLRLRQRRQEAVPELEELEGLYAKLRVADARFTADLTRQELEKVRTAVPASPPLLVFQRTLDTISSSLRLLNHQQALALVLHSDAKATQALGEDTRKLEDRSTRLRERLEALLKEARLEEIEALVRDAEQLLDEARALGVTGDRLVGAPPQRATEEQEFQQILEQVDRLLAVSDQLMRIAGLGLVPVDINTDDAMLTALADRLDLMNVRGELADNRRDVKLAADELKSVLNLSAEQTIRTKKNRPFGFSLDESSTRLGLTLDLPLNRKAQRNIYRDSLIDFQVGLRRLMEAEDLIKLEVRGDLRSLSLARRQYLISVAGAALAAERVLSTRLELALSFPGVAARDFLEAQDAYATALSDVADNRIKHIQQRMQLFLNLDLMLLDPSGFWPELYNEQFQPSPRYSLPADAGLPYGDIPGFLHVSEEIRQTAQ